MLLSPHKALFLLPQYFTHLTRSHSRHVLKILPCACSGELTEHDAACFYVFTAVSSSTFFTPFQLIRVVMGGISLVLNRNSVSASCSLYVSRLKVVFAICMRFRLILVTSAKLGFLKLSKGPELHHRIAFV